MSVVWDWLHVSSDQDSMAIRPLSIGHRANEYIYLELYHSPRMWNAAHYARMLAPLAPLLLPSQPAITRLLKSMSALWRNPDSCWILDEIYGGMSGALLRNQVVACAWQMSGQPCINASLKSERHRCRPGPLELLIAHHLVIQL